MKLLKYFAMSLVAFAMAACANETKTMDDTAKECDATKAVIENIMTRTSIRSFTDQPIAKDTLDLIVKAGMAAPSAVNAQPWAFIIITEKEILDSLNSIKPWFNLKTATAAVVVCGDMNKAMEGTGREYWIQDCSAATENILLAAHAYGIGAVWCGVYPSPDIVEGVSKTLNLPENFIPLNVVTMGYPAENPEPKDKFKTENIYYQKWSEK